MFPFSRSTAATDILEHNAKAILGLIWQLVMRYDITETEKGSKTLLLDCISATLPDSNITNFTTDWRDGRNLSALVDYCKPGLIPDHASLDPNNALENLKYAIRQAEVHLGVAPIVTPEDIAVEKPDERSLMTYLSQFCSSSDSPGLKALLVWLQQQLPDGLTVSNLSSDWVDGRLLGALANSLSDGGFREYEDFQQENLDHGKSNCERAMTAAEKLLGIEKTVEAKDFCNPELNITLRETYLVQFMYCMSRPKVLEKHLPTKAANGEKAWLSISLPDRTSKNIAATVKGRSLGEVPVSITATSELSYRIEFDPQKGDVYTLQATVDGVRLKGSPFTFDLLPPHPERVIHTNTVLPKKVGIPVILCFDATHAGRAAFTAEAVGEKSGTIPYAVDQVKTKSSTHKVSFIPLTSDNFIVTVKFDGELVPGSPFEIDLNSLVAPENVEVGRAIIEEPGVPVTVPVDVSKAGKAQLVAKCVGKLEGEVRVQIVEEGEGGGPVGVTFTPKMVDVYSLSIFYGKTEIPCSPFQVSLYPLPLDPAKVILSDPPMGALKSGEEISVGFDTFEAGNGDMTAVVSGATVGVVPAKVEKISKNKHFVRFTPPEKDVYRVHILWSDLDVPGSPFTISLIPKDHPYPSKVKVLGLPKPSEILVEGDVILFRVDTMSAGKGILAARVECEGLNSPLLGESAAEEGGVESGQGQNETEPGLRNGNVEPGQEERAQDVTTPTNAPEATPSSDGKTTPTNGSEATPTSPGVTTPTTTNGKPDPPPPREVTPVVRPVIQPSTDNAKIFNVSYKPARGGKHVIHLTWADQPVPDSPIALDIVTPRIAVSGSAVVIELRTQYKRKNMKVQAVSRDTGAHHKVKIDKITSGHFKIVFQPKELGVHLVHVLVKDRPIDGSPFIVRYVEASDQANIVISGLEARVFVGEATTFTIDTRGAGLGDLTVTPSISMSTLNTIGASQEDLRSVRLFHNRDGTFSAIFTPSMAGEESIDVRFAGAPIPGSPFPVSVLKRETSEPPESRKKKRHSSGISGLNLENEKFRVNIPHRLKLHCEDLGEGSLDVACKPSNAAVIEIIKIEETENSSWIRIVPKKTGKHSITVRYGGNHILGSPFHVQFLPRGDASKCVMIETLPECKADIGDQVAFCMSTKGAGKGIVTASATSTSRYNQGVEVPVTVIHHAKNHFNLLFTPSEGLNYILEILYDEDGIQGSPFQIALGDASHVRSQGEGLILAWSGRSASFVLDAEDAGPGELSVVVEREEEDGALVEIEPEISSVEDRQFDVSYLPPVHGKYWITVKWGGVDIPGSPFEVNCKKPLEPSQFSLASPIPVAYHGKPAGVVCKCEVAIEEEDKMAVLIHFKDGEKQELSDVKKGEGNFYDITIPSLPIGECSVHCLWDGDHVKGSPYEMRVLDQPSSDDFTVEAVEAKDGVIACKVLGPEYCFLYGRLTSAVHSNELSDEYSVAVQISETTPCESLITFRPETGGSYDLSIFYDMVHVKGSPYSLISTDASQCCSKGKGLQSAQTLSSNKFLVFTENAGPGELRIEIKSDAIVVNPEIVSTSEMLYSISYRPPSAGVYTITVYWDTQQVPGSPFTVVCCDPSRYSIPQPTKEASLGKPLKIGVKESTEAPDFEKIIVFARSKDRNTYQGEVGRGSDGSYICSVQPPNLGKYSIHIRCNDFEIPGSPFRARIMPPPIAENVKASGPGLSNGVVGKATEFSLDISEAGHGHISYKVQGPKDGFKMDMHRHSDRPDTIVCEYHPKHAGLYNISVMWAGTHIPDSPFSVTVEEPTPSAAEEGEGEGRREELVEGEER